jgi:hypothetical protein
LTAKTRSDVWVVSLDRRLAPSRIVGTESSETLGQFSPNGRWIAYKSDESGVAEVYVRAFDSTGSIPAAGDRSTISRGGGHQPRWSADGRELFYFTADGALMAVTVDTSGSTLAPGRPVELFRPNILGGGPTGEVMRWDVAPDGQRFLMITESAAPSRLTLVLNWQSGLKQP